MSFYSPEFRNALAQVATDLENGTIKAASSTEVDDWTSGDSILWMVGLFGRRANDEPFGCIAGFAINALCPDKVGEVWSEWVDQADHEDPRWLGTWSLFFPVNRYPTAEEAASAIRSYLATGEPGWLGMTPLEAVGENLEVFPSEEEEE